MYAREPSRPILPDDAIQHTYTAIVKRNAPDAVGRQFAHHLKELAQLCNAAHDALHAQRAVTDLWSVIESKAHELRQDGELLEEVLAVRRKSATRPAARAVTPSIDPTTTIPAALTKLAQLHSRLNVFLALANQSESADPTTRQTLRTALRAILTVLEPPKPQPRAPPEVHHPTHGLYTPTPRAPRERSTVVPASAKAVGTVGPTPEDLQPTLDAPITPEIQALAAELGHSAAAIYEYVRNTIEFESYYGSLKGALATLWAGRGNDVDQASLLIALLRAAGIPCRYVQGTVRMPIHQAMDWLGVKDPYAASQVLLAGNIPTVLVVDEAQQIIALKMEHTWVVAYMAYGHYRGIPQDASGAQWIPLDPSVKVKTYQPGLAVFSSVPFDEDRYLSKRQRELPTDFYQEQLIGSLNQTSPGRSYTEIGYIGAIVREALGVLPSTLPYAFPVVAFLGEFSEWPSTLRNTVDVEVLTADETVSLLQTTLVLPEIILKRVTLSYPQSGNELIPTLKVDGGARATGPPRPLGESHHLKLTIHIPNVTPENTPLPVTTYPNIVAGEYYAIGLDGHHVSSSLLDRRINRMLSLQSTIGTPQEDPDEIEGEFLNLSLLLYLRNLFHERQVVSEVSHIKRVQSLPNIGVSRAHVSIETAFDLPFTISPDGLVIDVRRSFVSITPIDGAAGNDRAAPSFRLGGLTASALEHEVWEELVKIESVSTVKGLQFAREFGIPVLTITPANLNEMLSVLDSVPPERRISPQWRQTIMNLLSGAAPADSVQTPQEKLLYNDWRGSVGLVVHDGGHGLEFLIEGGLAGGGTTLLERIVSAVEEFLDTITGAIHAFFDGDPVNIANGNLVHTETDFTIQSRGLPLPWKRVYNSKLNYDGPLGFGWVHFYDVNLTEHPDGSVTFLDDDGGRRLFTRNPDGSYIPPPGHALTLTKTGNGFSMRDKSGLVYRFRTDGKLTSLQDPNSNTVTCSYNGAQLTQVTDALGRALTLTYNAQGKLETVADFTERTWAYAYDAEGNLIQVTDPLTQTMRYEYFSQQYNPDNNHNIKQLIDREGHAMAFTYYTNDRVFRHTNDLGETRTFSYNIFWQETTVTNEDGSTKTFKYDEQGNLTKLIEETGAIWRYVWDERHNRLSDTDPLGNLTAYTYDGVGNLLTVTDPLGHLTVHTYEPTFSKRTSTTDRRGFRTSFTYDSTGNLTGVEDPLGRRATFEYDGFGNRTAQTDRRSVRTAFAYDAFDHLTEQRTILLPADVVTRFEYDALGRMTARLDANNHRTQWDYDAIGQIRSVTQFLDEVTPVVTSFTYDKNGRTLSVTDAESRLTRFEYDAAGRRTKLTDALEHATEFRYDQMGRVIAVTPPNGAVTQFAYDGKGNLTKTIDPLGNASLLRYNLLDRVVASTDANGNTAQSEYDALQRLTVVTDPLGNTTRFAYDPNGNRETLTDAEERLTRFVYDPLNRLIQVVDAAGGLTDYGYDTEGHLIRITDANGHTMMQEFDELARLTARMDPLDNRRRFTYDGVGNPTSATDPNGQTIQLRYDALDRLTKKVYPDLTEVTFAYDRVGNRLLTQNPAASFTYQYDPLNRLTSVTDSRFGRPLAYAYDAVGNRTRLIDLEGFATAYQYDAANRLIRLEDPFGGQTQYAYDAAGHRTSRRSPNNVVSLSTYDAANRLTLLETKHVMTDNLIHRAGYTYDCVGNRLTMTDTQGEHRYNYDALDRLTSAMYPDGFFEDFAYDAVGNRLSKTDLAGTTSSTYDAANRLLQEGETLHAYDANGNLIRKTTGTQIRSFRYDPENRLVAVDDEGTTIATYTYDAQDRRIAKQLGPQRTQYLYEGQQLLAEYTTTNALKARYVHGPGIDEPLLMVRNGLFSYLHQDGLGSVVAATDARGVLAEQYRYRAFGEPSVFDAAGQALASSTLGNPYLFTGREFDQETGLYYYRKRYYAHGSGRFVTQDLFPGSPTNPATWHRYSYAHNNPINRLDPLGLRAEAAESSRMVVLDDINRRGTIIIDPIPAHLPLPQGDPIPERIPLPQGDAIPEGEPGDGSLIDPIPERDFWDRLFDFLSFDQAEDSGEADRPKDPPPFPDDPEERPGPEWIWRGEGELGSREGNWWNPETDEWIHNEPDSPSHGPHKDYEDREGNRWRRYPDGTWERK